MTDAPQDSATDWRSEELSAEERAVIERFAIHIRRNQTCVMSVGEIVQQTDTISSEVMHSAMRRLAKRGWLVANPAVHWENHHQCVLIGEALRMALTISAESGE